MAADSKTDVEMPTPEQIRAMAEKCIAYLQSHEGRMQLRQSKEECRRIHELFARARDISWERLHAPFTI
jgi:hypothetical protein